MKIRQLTHVKRKKNELGNYIYSARIMAGQFPTPEITLGEWVQALSAMISGIAWVDKCYS